MSSTTYLYQKKIARHYLKQVHSEQEQLRGILKGPIKGIPVHSKEYQHTRNGFYVMYY